MNPSYYVHVRSSYYTGYYIASDYDGARELMLSLRKTSYGDIEIATFKDNVEFISNLSWYGDNLKIDLGD